MYISYRSLHNLSLKHAFVLRFTTLSSSASCRQFLVLEWRATHVENFLSQIATFSQFHVYLNVTQAKRMTSWLLLDSFHPAISYRREFKRNRKRRIIVYGSVTRYGPRTSCQRNGVNSKDLSSFSRGSSRQSRANRARSTQQKKKKKKKKYRFTVIRRLACLRHILYFRLTRNGPGNLPLDWASIPAKLGSRDSRRCWGYDCCEDLRWKGSRLTRNGAERRGIWTRCRIMCTRDSFVARSSDRMKFRWI